VRDSCAAQEDTDVKRLFLFIALAGFAAAPAAFADIPDYMLNVNGTTYCPALPQPGSPGLCDSFGGFAAAGATGTLDTAFPGGTGLGTETLVFNPGAPGTYYVNLWVFEAVNVANPFDQYGSTSGSPTAGETWQIDVPDTTYAGELGTAGAGTIVGNTATNALSDTNLVPGQTSNSDLTSCGFFTGGPAVANCNDAASMALGFAFTLAAGEEEVVTFTVQQTAPGGFYLATTDPTSGTTDYFFGSAISRTIGNQPVPEAGSWILLSAIAGILGLVSRRRWATR
jgi:hypothetical protein